MGRSWSWGVCGRLGGGGKGGGGGCMCMCPTIYTYPHADIYASTRQWQAHGYGVMEWTMGTRYEGLWECNKRCGHGIYYYADGSVYHGDWCVVTGHCFVGLISVDGRGVCACVRMVGGMGSIQASPTQQPNTLSPPSPGWPTSGTGAACSSSPTAPSSWAPSSTTSSTGLAASTWGPSPSSRSVPPSARPSVRTRGYLCVNVFWGIGRSVCRSLGRPAHHLSQTNK